MNSPALTIPAQPVSIGAMKRCKCNHQPPALLTIHLLEALRRLLRLESARSLKILSGPQLCMWDGIRYEAHSTTADHRSEMNAPIAEGPSCLAVLEIALSCRRALALLHVRPMLKKKRMF